jgi:hypothetical protein
MHLHRRPLCRARSRWGGGRRGAEAAPSKSALRTLLEPYSHTDASRCALTCSHSLGSSDGDGSEEEPHEVGLSEGLSEGFATFESKEDWINLCVAIG